MTIAAARGTAASVQIKGTVIPACDGTANAAEITAGKAALAAATNRNRPGRNPDDG